MLAGTAQAGDAPRRNLVISKVVRKTVPLTHLASAIPNSLWSKATGVRVSERTVAHITEHGVRTSNQKPPAAEGTQLIATNKVLNLSLLVEANNMTASKWIDAVLTLPTKKVSAETVGQILKGWPDDTDIKKIHAFNGPITTLGPVDKFFVELRRVPTIKEKFQAFHLFLSLSARTQWIRDIVAVASDAVPELLSASMLPGTLQYVYDYCNVMTRAAHTTPEQRERGFRVQDITKFLTVKTFDQVPFMDLLVIDLHRDEPHLEAFPSELTKLHHLTRISVPAVLAEYSVLEEAVANMAAELQNSASATGIPVRFRDRIAAYHARLQVIHDEVVTAMGALQKIMEVFKALVAEVNEFFGESPHTDFSETVTPLVTFITSYAETRERLSPSPPVYEDLSDEGEEEEDDYSDDDVKGIESN